MSHVIGRADLLEKIEACKIRGHRPPWHRSVWHKGVCEICGDELCTSVLSEAFCCKAPLAC